MPFLLGAVVLTLFVLVRVRDSAYEACRGRTAFLGLSMGLSPTSTITTDHSASANESAFLRPQTKFSGLD